MSTWVKTEKGLFRALKFKNNKDILDFIEKLGVISDAMNHHADYKNPIKKQLEIYLLTHSANNQITEKDYALADKIDELYKAYE